MDKSFDRETYEKVQNQIFGDSEKNFGDYETRIQDKTYLRGRENILITDGIADVDEWAKNKIRPLFILKEAYDKSSDPSIKTKWNEFTDYVNLQRGEISSLTWKRIAQWTHFIFNQNKEEALKVSNWEDKSNGDNVPLLKKIALINIKKYDGMEISNNTILEQHAIKHRDLLIKQINAIQPTIIICGYTGWLVDVVYNKTIRKIKNGYYVYKLRLDNGDEIPLIDFWHPCNFSKSDSTLLNLLQESYNYSNENFAELKNSATVENVCIK